MKVFIYLIFPDMNFPLVCLLCIGSLESVLTVHDYGQGQ